MINVAMIAEAIRLQLEQHADLVDFAVVERDEYVNTDPARTPWVGVYHPELTLEPWTMPRGWKAIIVIKILVQVHNAESGAAAGTDLGDAVRRVITALLSDLTFGGTVDMQKSFKVDFTYQETASETLDFQWAIITLKGEARTS